MDHFYKRVSCLLLSISLFVCISNGQKKADSLSNLAKTTKSDTTRLIALNALFKELYYAGETDSAEQLGMYAKNMSEKLLAYSGLDATSKRCLQIQRIVAYSNLGKLYVGTGSFPKAFKYDTLAVNLAKELGDKTNIAMTQGNLGSLYTCTGNYVEALKDELQALAIEEDIGDRVLMASAYTNIGNIYTAERNYGDAIKNHMLCLAISRNADFKQGMVWAYNNLGGIYEQLAKHDEALNAYDSCLILSRAIGYTEGIAASYANLGVIYAERGQFDLAVKDQEEARNIYEEIGYNQYVANCDQYLGETYLKKKEYDEADDNLEKGLDMALKGGYKEVAKAIYMDLSNLYEEGAKQKGKDEASCWEKAHEYFKLYTIYNDSLFNEAVRKKTEQAEIRDEFDKKEVIIKAEHDKKDALLEGERKRQQFIEYCLLGGLVLVLALAFFIFRGYQLKRKANVVMAKQKELVEQKNTIIESKNKAITDSINYAHLIQNAMLVPEAKIKEGLKDYFILYKPKDIVSGDFYFFKERPEIVGHTAKNLIAACDCTGHGVPGAFMSLIGNEKLHDAIERSSDIGGALKMLNKNIKNALHQSTDRDSTRDGMDIALCSVSHLDASRAALSKGQGKEGQTILRYAGANRPLWMIRRGKSEIEEIRATKNSIGGFTEDTAEFETHTRYLDKGDTFYIFTDGYPDQFGGTEGKKLTTRRFREFLISVRDYSMAEQKDKLKKYLDEWRGPHEQVDDILVIGVRV